MASSNSHRNGGVGYTSSITSNGTKVITDRQQQQQLFSSLNSINPKSSTTSSSSLKPKSSLRRSSTGSIAGSATAKDESRGVRGRVRVAVRLRPRNAEEAVADADMPDCVELQPELKRLKLRRNNWDSDTFEFDEVLTEFASQKRVYEVVAKPVVEGVLDGYNGTVMAYGQTGTGKTYTLARLGEEDKSARGIMVRALEDILAEISPETDSVSISYLQVNVKRSIKGKDSALSVENGNASHAAKILKPPIVRRGKLVIVDLAGSERIDKSGSEGHTLEEAKSINLSLSALGKCINALAENSPHVPVRDSKLTRLLRDSFGGTARTSLIVTIGPSPQHRGETASTIMFGQRAMKVENMLKIKEEFDYKSLSRRLDIQLDKLIAENERQQKTFQDEIQRIASEAQKRIAEVESNCAGALESTEINEFKKLLQNETLLRRAAEEEISGLRNEVAQWKRLEAAKSSEILKLRKLLEDESQEKAKLEEEIAALQSQLLQLSYEADETRRNLDKGEMAKLSGDLDSLLPQSNHQSSRDFADGASMAKLFEQVGLQKILSLLEADDADVRIHAVKVVANLAAEESNQERIVEAGGLTSLLMLLRSSDDETIQRVAAGAIANLAMSETNQELIVSQGGLELLSTTAANANDPQTLRMVAGAIANLCGNDKLQMKLRGEGGIKALLGMVRCRHPDVLAQVARGIANFAKCESRAFTQGTKMGRSLLIEDGALPWIVQNANNEASPIRRHIELALCHLAQHEVNAKDMITARALWELVRISRDCSRDDIRNLAHKTLTHSPAFQVELRRLRIDYG
ncbi:kinesin-like protein KIN-UB isoform X2 [Coffea arabica]|uniref:Kinesin-like protein n=1 Tax=Coffea arabica TaxID=13443 RepID=A0ABM4VJV9_COFAR